jgi:hypothetical protein
VLGSDKALFLELCADEMDRGWGVFREGCSVPGWRGGTVGLYSFAEDYFGAGLKGRLLAIESRVDRLGAPGDQKCREKRSTPV